jgi:hypothetical protein
MESGIAKAAAHRARWQSQFRASIKIEKGKINFGRFH